MSAFGTHSHLAFVTLPLPIPSVAFLKLTASSRLSAPPSGSPKCLRFGLWLTLCTVNIYLLTYLLFHQVSLQFNVKQHEVANCIMKKISFRQSLKKMTCQGPGWPHNKVEALYIKARIKAFGTKDKVKAKNCGLMKPRPRLKLLAIMCFWVACNMCVGKCCNTLTRQDSVICLWSRFMSLFLCSPNTPVFNCFLQICVILLF